MTLHTTVGRKTKNIDNQIIIAKKKISVLPPNCGKSNEKNDFLYLYVAH